MLLLIKKENEKQKEEYNLNTSHVTVNRYSLTLIHHMPMNLNTSHVTVNHQ